MKRAGVLQEYEFFAFKFPVFLMWRGVFALNGVTELLIDSYRTTERIAETVDF